MPPTVETGHESAPTHSEIHTDLGGRYALAMAQSVCLVVSAGDRARLEAIVADRNRPQKHVARAWLVLLSADRLDVAAVARRAGVSRPAVWRWQRHYAEEGVAGLLRDQTRKPGKTPLGGGLVRRVVAMTCAEPPSETAPLDRPRHGRSRRGLAALGAADLGRPQAPAAPLSGPSSARAIPTSWPSWRRSSGSTWPRRAMPWSYRWTRRAEQYVAAAAGRLARYVLLNAARPSSRRPGESARGREPPC